MNLTIGVTGGRLLLLPVLGALGALGGCSDAAVATPVNDMTVAAPADLAVRDLAEAGDLLTPLGIGQECLQGTECPAGLLCLGAHLDPQLPPRGYCTRACQNDPDCGAGAFCGPPIGTVGQNLCWLRCGAGGTCDNPDHVCGRRLNGFLDLVNQACLLGNASAKEGAPCLTFGDCNRNQTCATNPFEAPNGICATVGCSVGDDTTCLPGNNAHCLDFSSGPAVCLPGCTDAKDCRQNEGYVCAMPLSLPRFCSFSHRPVGAACAMGGDCGPGNTPWKCLVTQSLPDGYCTGIGCTPTDQSSCPTRSSCIVIDGVGSFCGADCQQDKDCLTVGMRQTPLTCKPFDATRPALKACLP